MKKDVTLGNLDALYVGKIYVQVADDFLGGLYARTDDGILGAADLGFELRVTAFHYEEEEDPDVSSWIRELLDKMRLALARCFIWGEMVPYSDLREDEDKETFKKVLNALPEGYLDITPALSMEALAAQSEQDAAFVSGITKLTRLMEEEGLRRGLNKEERAKMTLGEIFQEKSTEEEEK
jgi:hypothetical protein